MANTTNQTLQTTSEPTVGLVHALAGPLLASIRAVAFWAAVLLPLITLLGMWSGIAVDLRIMFTLVGVNAVCVVIGHPHARSR